MSNFLEPFPTPILEPVNRDAAEDERTLIRVAADLDTDMRFGSRWLVVTDQRVLLIDGAQRREWPLEKIQSAQLDTLVGGGRLVLRNGNRELGVLYFTNSALPKFAEVAAGIERLIRTGDAGLPAAVDRTRCESCSRLLPEKNGVCPKCLDRWATVRALFKYLAPYRLGLISLVVVLAASIAAELAAPLAFRQILDRIVVPGMALRVLAGLVGILLAARLSMWLCETARGRLSVRLGARVTANIRQTLFDRVVRFPIRFIDAWSLVMSALLLAGILGVLFYLSPSLTAAILLPVPLIILWTWFLWKRLRRAQDRQSSSMASLSVQVSESLTGIRVVKAFCQEDKEYQRFLECNDRVRLRSAHAERESFIFFTVIYFLMNTGVFLVWFIGGRQVLNGGLTVGSLLAAVSYLWMLYWPLQWFGQVSNSLSQALTGAVQFFELTDSPVEEPSLPGLPVRRIDGRVCFRNVTFGYNSNRPVLNEINFRVEPGEVIGVIGRSGTGKTTLMNLLCRFYEADRGTILIDDLDIRNYRLDELRKQVAIVPQDIFLFSGTIEDNIRYGCPDATFEEAVAAAKMANAHRFILERPDGYDSLVGPRGDRLSGGERQRIAIARAILANPQILILDEATSSLDVESELAIQRALASVARNRTTFIIAHRLSTIRNSDRLLVLDRGRIVEMGTYDELLAHEGLLWEFANAYSETRDLQ